MRATDHMDSSSGGEEGGGEGKFEQSIPPTHHLARHIHFYLFSIRSTQMSLVATEKVDFSSQGYNTDAAWRVTKKIRRALQLSEDDDDFAVWMEGHPDVMNFVECFVPKQNNGYDRDLFALGFAG